MTVVTGRPYEFGTYRYAGSCASRADMWEAPASAYTSPAVSAGMPGSGCRNGPRRARAGAGGFGAFAVVGCWTLVLDRLLAGDAVPGEQAARLVISTAA